MTTSETLNIELKNGMNALIRPDRRAPVVAFFVWYRVGARNEVPGSTGISHMVEHMLFKGTARFPAGQIDRLITAHGGRWNGFTGDDYTAFYEVLPSEHLQLAVKIEADRMTNCTISDEEFEREREVVLSERQGSENNPAFWLTETVRSTAFSVHPYRQMVIGQTQDLRNLERDQLYDYYRTYYTPRNATAVLVGDADPEDAKNLLSEHFGKIDPGPEIPPVNTTEPPQQGAKRVTVRRPGRNRRLYTVFHIPAASHPDIVPLHVTEAILSGGTWPFGLGNASMGKSSRMYRQLVRTGTAVYAAASATYALDPHLFGLSLIPTPNTESRQAEEELNRLLDELREKGPSSEELQRAQKQLVAQHAYSEGVASLASGLGALSIISSWEFYDSFPQQVQQVTAEDVRRVCDRYLQPQRQTTGWFLPERPPQAPRSSSAPDETPQAKSSVRGYRDSGYPQAMGQPPESSANTAPKLPGPDDICRCTMPGGATFLGYRHDGCRLFRASVLIPSGSMCDPDSKEGASYLMGDLIDAGTSNRNSEQLASAMDALGMGFSSSVSSETTVLSLQSLPEDRRQALQFAVDLLTDAVFPVEELQKAQRRLAAVLDEQEDNTEYLANRTLKQMIYPQGHPFHHPAIGTAEGIQNITREDLLSLYHKHYHPQDAVVVAVADLPPAQMAKEAAELLSQWLDSKKPQDIRSCIEVPSPRQPSEILRESMAVGGKSQTDIAAGAPAIPRQHPDYDALRLAFLLLGGVGLGGRIGRELRDRQGLAYHISSRLNAVRGGGTWAIKAGVDPANQQRLLQGIEEHLRRLVCTPPSNEELAEIKGYLLGNAQISLETTRGLVTNLLNIEYYQLGLDYLSTYSERFRVIETEQVQQAFAKHVNPEAYFVASVGPPEQRPAGR